MDNIMTVAEAVGETISDLPTNQLLQDLDERIAFITKEINDKKFRIHTLQDDCNRIKEQYLPAFGAAFFDLMEQDPVWSEESSQEFMDKYIRSPFPAVTEFAKVHLEIFNINQQVKQTEEQLQVLLQDKRYNNLLPAELYRLIQNATDRAESNHVRLETALRAEISDLHAQVAQMQTVLQKLMGKVEDLVASNREAEAERKSNKWKNYFNFSAPANTKWDHFSGRLTYSLTNVHNYAISREELSVTSESSWRVTVNNCTSWVYIGIIGVPVPGLGSYSDATSCGWAGNSQVYVRGTNNPSLGGFGGLKKGDVVVLTYSPFARQLTMEKASTVYTIDTGELSQAYLHSNVHCTGTELLIEEIGNI